MLTFCDFRLILLLSKQNLIAFLSKIWKRASTYIFNHFYQSLKHSKLVSIKLVAICKFWPRVNFVRGDLWWEGTSSFLGGNSISRGRYAKIQNKLSRSVGSANLKIFLIDSFYPKNIWALCRVHIVAEKALLLFQVGTLILEIKMLKFKTNSTEKLDQPTSKSFWLIHFIPKTFERCVEYILVLRKHFFFFRLGFYF